MRAIVVDSTLPGRLRLGDVAEPKSGPDTLTVAVKAISLNRGEVRTALTDAANGARPGWDFAGVVTQGAADGQGPKAGARVVGMLFSGSWAETLTVPVPMVAELPDSVSFEAAAALPVAALTALYALKKGPQARGRKVLITGASGGVGVFAVQLAALAGDQAVAAIRNPAYEPLMRRLGAAEVAVGADLAMARAAGPYDLILESIGGETLSAALGMLAPGGTCVTFGASDTSVVTFDTRAFRVGGTSLYGLYAGYELQAEPPTVGLAHVASLVGQGKLDPMVEVVEPWEKIAEVAQALIDRRYVGKAVLTVS